MRPVNAACHNTFDRGIAAYSTVLVYQLCLLFQWGRVVSEGKFEDFVVLVRQSGLPYDDVDLERLFDGYLKLQGMISTMKRPANLTTGLAVDFQPEPVR